MRALITSGLSQKDILSCFTLENNKKSSFWAKLRISMCVSSKDPFRITTFLDIDGIPYTESYSLNFDASSNIADD
eukprot:UN01871